jgi:hypothetical protein
MSKEKEKEAPRMDDMLEKRQWSFEPSDDASQITIRPPETLAPKEFAEEDFPKSGEVPIPDANPLTAHVC